MEISEFQKAYLGCFPRLNSGLYRQAFTFHTKQDENIVLDFVKKEVWIQNDKISFSRVTGGEQYEMRIFLRDGTDPSFIYRDFKYLNKDNKEVRMRIEIEDKTMDMLFWILVSTIR